MNLVELLERREVLAQAVGFWDSSEGQLLIEPPALDTSAQSVVVSIDGNDDIQFTCNSTQGTIVDATTFQPVTVDASLVEKLIIALGDNNDAIDLSAIDGSGLATSPSIVLVGGDGDDMIVGGGYGEIIEGGDGDDDLDGGVGSDTYVFDSVGDPDTDTIEEGPAVGEDSFDFSQMTQAVDLTLGFFSDPTSSGNEAEVNSDLTIVRAQQNVDALVIERIIGTDYDDTLGGASWATTLEGGEGEDTYLASAATFQSLMSSNPEF